MGEGGLHPGGWALHLWGGSLHPGGLGRSHLPELGNGQYASYWNAFLLILLYSQYQHAQFISFHRADHN